MRTAGRSRWWLGSLVGSDRRGTIAVEFALIVPILLLAFGAVLDLGWLMLAEYKARQIAATVADLAARTEVIDADDAHDMALAGDAIGAPLRMDLDGKVWITYVRTRAADGSTVEWQIHEGGGEARASSAGTGDAGEGDGGDEAGNSPVDWSSRIGSPGSSASIGDLELEAVDEFHRGRHAAAVGVLLQDQRAQPRLLQDRGRGQPVVSGPHDDGVVVSHARQFMSVMTQSCLL